MIDTKYIPFPTPARTFKLSVLRLVQWAGVILLFTPKINLISVEGQTAGLRLDDVVLVLLLVYFFFNFLLPKRTTFSSIELLIFSFITLCFFSNIINLLFFQRSNPLYTIRYIEYFTFYYIGYYCARDFSLRKIVTTLLLINAFLMIGQRFGVIGGFSSIGFAGDVSDRVIGLTGGPWEIGLIINYIYVILLYATYKEKSSATKNWVLFGITFLLILLTGSRMATLAHLLILTYYFYSKVKNKLVLLGVVGGSIVITLFLLQTFENPLTERSANLFSASNIEQFTEYYRSLVIDVKAVEFPEMPFDENSDMSWLMRISKWSFAIKSWTIYPTAWLLGIGPGTLGLALDGGWVRITAETGLVGLLLFIFFLRKAAELNLVLRLMGVALAVSMLMIDVYLAYKCMALFFFTVGYFTQRKEFRYRIHII